MALPVDNYREAVAAEVRAMLGRTRVTQTDLAHALGMSQAAISRRLNCELAFDLDDIFNLSRFFDVELSALLPEPTSVEGVSTVGHLRRSSTGCTTADESRTTANLDSADLAA